MKTFIRLHREIVEQAIDKLRELIKSKGKESKHSSKKCLGIINEDYMFNLSGNRYLTEINEECLVDDKGYEYNFYVLDTEDFLSTIDYLIETYTKK